METLDLFKLHKDEHVSPKEPALVTAKSGKYLAISGQGTPGNELFQSQIGALYGLAYTIKMKRKYGDGRDFKVPPLEGIYWGPDPDACIMEQPTTALKWKLLIRMPANASARELKAAAAEIAKKGKTGPFDAVRLETLNEGKCVQVLHIGPYNAEVETIARMQAFAESKRTRLSGPHHEIYLSDPRRVPPERIKTILRQPVVAAKEASAASA